MGTAFCQVDGGRRGAGRTAAAVWVARPWPACCTDRASAATMNFLLRRYLWVVDLIGIGIGSALAGHATALMITAALPSPAAAQPGSAHAAMTARPDKSDKSD